MGRSSCQAGAVRVILEFNQVKSNGWDREPCGSGLNPGNSLDAHELRSSSSSKALHGVRSVETHPERRKYSSDET